VQQKVLQSVVSRIVVEDSRVIIEHVVPTGPVRLQTEHHRLEYVVHYIFETLYKNTQIGLAKGKALCHDGPCVPPSVWLAGG